MYCENFSCGQERLKFQALALKQNPAFSLNFSGPSNENYRENGSFVSLVLAAIISNVKFWGRNNSREYKVHWRVQRGWQEEPGVISVVGFTYLSVCTSEMRWPSSEHDLLLNKNVYSTASGVYLNSDLNLDFSGRAEKSVSDFLHLFL